ncbi:MAG TPA: hypothetical protein VF331_07760 [Polyangiales bacterium]
MPEFLPGKMCERGARARDAAAVLLSMLCVVTCTRSAQAHDPPLGTGLFARDPGLLIRSNRGLLWSPNGTSDFRLLCNEALGITTTEVPSIVARSDGRWVIGTSHGVMLASADLCSLQPVASLTAQAVPALVVDPKDAARLYASTGQAGITDGLQLSTDQGTSFAPYGNQAQNRVYDHVAVSAADPTWLEISGLRVAPDMASLSYFFGSSTDRGLTFTHHDFPLAADEYAIALLGLHPTMRGTAYAAVQADQTTDSQDRIIRSTDFGQSWSDLARAHRVEAFAIDDTGKTLWVGARDGLWRSRDAGASFEHVQTDPVFCLLRRGARLYVCDEHANIAGVSVSDDAGDTLTPLMHFTDVTKMITCPVSSSTAIACAGPWGDWERELAIGFVLDGGMPRSDAGQASADAGLARDAAAIPGDAAAGAARAKATGCACMVSARGGTRLRGGSALLLLAAAAGARLRRRRRGAMEGRG